MKSVSITGRSSCRESGIALVTTLMVLSIMIGLSLVMYLSVSSDMLINNYYRNFRGSFYAADSGLNIARAMLVNQVQVQVPASFAVPPLANPALVGSTATTNLMNTYGSTTSLAAGSGTNSWPESFQLTGATLGLAPSSPIVTTRDGSGNPTGYSYTYNYTLTSQGTSRGSQQATVSEKGSFTFNITGGAAATNVSFAAFGGFVDHYPQCLGPLVPGTMTGPMFTNGAWEFMTGGDYIFTDPVGQADANADYWVDWNCFQSPTTSYSYDHQIVKPTFQGGFNMNQPRVPLPSNDFSQKRAVLDGQGLNTTAPTNADLNTALKNISGTAYPPGGASSGLYFAYNSSGGANVMTGGGMYIEGDASVTLTPSGASAQVYTIGQGGTTTVVTIDPLATPPASWNCPAGTVGTTTAVSGSTTTNICSVPMNMITNMPGTMLYVNGAITSLSGPGPGQGAIQDGTQLTITAKNDITATGDVLYKTEPVTTTQNQIIPGTNPACCAGSPVDTLIPGNDRNQVLGIFTLTGNFNTHVSTDWSNIQVDGSIATISNGGTGGFLNTGACVNTFNNVGGQVQNSIYGACMAVENVYFDRRYTNRPGFAPPWFPSTTVTQGGAQATNVTTTVQRIQWLNQTTVQ
jgi:Tfp pilus assembly protein PilX